MPRKNTSGYLGVSWHKTARKWAAYIARDGIRQSLGLFEKAEDAHAAYIEVAARLDADRPDPREVLLAAARTLYEQGGPAALTAASLNKSGVSEGRLRRIGLNHASLLAELGLAEEYQSWRSTSFTYAGKRKPRWDWERVVLVARELVAQEGDLPTVQWCRLNGHGQLTNAVFKSGRTWEDLRLAVGLPTTVMQKGRPRYFPSRAGIRWRSRPEACLSDFLYARGIEHRRGERYPDSYAVQSGRAYGRYDMHFTARSGEQIDVEVWGDIPDAWSHGRYSVTRAKKEAFHGNRATFLGLHYLDCQSEARLAELLKAYIGAIEPFRFDKAQDRHIETAHWSDADELLETCRRLAAERPDGVFPNEQWLRRRGRYATRPGEAYNTLATAVTKVLGGTRNVRKLLDQAEASTIKWTPASVVEAWREYEARTRLTPAMAKGKYRKGAGNEGTLKEGARIYEVARRLGVIGQARDGRTGRKVKWTAAHTEHEWRAFCAENGRTPTQCMSKAQRERLPRNVTDRATRVYSAAARLGLLERLRQT
jgi:hypothetical protein